MKKTDKLIDWEENERVDHNRDGIDDRIEPNVPDVSAGSRKLADRLRNDSLADPTITGGERTRSTVLSRPCRMSPRALASSRNG